MNLVIDCSYMVSMLLQDEMSSSVDLSDCIIYTPSIFMIECMSAINIACKRSRIDQAQYELAIAKLLESPFSIDKSCANTGVLHKISALSIKCGLTPYDASYLELAIRTNAKLATFDKALAKAAKSCGLEVVT